LSCAGTCRFCHLLVLDGTVVTREHSPEDDEDAATRGPTSDSDVTPASTHDEQIEKILIDAHRRDDEADIRDGVSDKRSEAADLEAFLDTAETYSGLGERRAAAMDRSHAKSDRESSAKDRVRLTQKDDDEPGGDVVTP
jgi:hypothetical protein